MSALRENLGLRLLSLVLAVIVWAFAQGEQTYQTTVVAPVEYVMPDDLVLLNDAPPPDQVVIQASGSRAALRSLQEQLREVQVRFLVDVEEAEPGRTVHSFRKLPPGVADNVTIDTISPAEVELVFDEVIRKTLPVLLRTHGTLPPGFVETGREVVPGEVEMVGSKTELMDLEFVQTLPLRLGNSRSSYDGELGLDVASLHLTPEAPRNVRAQLGVEEAMAEQEMRSVPLRPGPGMEGLELAPETLRIRLHGPVPVLEELAISGLHAELQGDRTVLVLDEDGEGAVAYSPTPGGPDSPPAVRLVMQHERAAEVEVRSVDPLAYTVTRIAPPEPEQPDQPPLPTPEPAQE